MKKPLPDVKQHLLWFVGGLVGYTVVALLESNFPGFPDPIGLMIALPCWLAVVVPLVGYSLVYPFLHLLGRYEGQSQQAWMIWLVLDTIGLTFGLVRLWYYLAVIIPDFRSERAKRAQLKTGANKTRIPSPITPRVD